MTIYEMAQNLGAPLRMFRTKLRLTQEEMAARLGIDRGRYAQWERDRSMPPLEYRLKLNELGMSGLPGVELAAPFKPGPDDTGLYQILIETIFDETRPMPLRLRARSELYRRLDMAPPEDL